MKQLFEQASKVANLRARHNDLASVEKQALGSLAELEEWRLYNLAKSVRLSIGKSVKFAEEKLREILVEAKRESGANNFGSGLSAYESNRVRVTDQDVMYRWLADNARYVIPVNASKLLKLVQSEEVPGAELYKEPQGKLGKDLSMYESDDACLL